ncbi:MAG: imidazole glycerol phosphate synthase subunit HisH, partial [Armatimonadetes bacterium]|nr:imidazole glycerol phosphate synthase subunit HisH [Armatimonadota bacterium]
SAMARLAAVGFPERLRVQVARGTPLVGVCLGMQLLFERSEESADVAGLGILPGDVRRLPAGLKVPHMGWNRLIVQERRSLLDGIPDGAFVYFVHSYVAQPDQPVEVVASTSYGVEFPAIVQCGRVIGMQFHPEKSGEIGQRLLRHLVGWVAGTRSARSVPQPS